MNIVCTQWCCFQCFESLANTYLSFQITPDLVHLMTDDELNRYIPSHVDRLRIRQQLKKEEPERKNRTKLLTVLHKKLEKARKGRKKELSSSEEEEEEEESMRRQYGNKNAVKGTRYVEIGWIHKVHQRAKQVRSKSGGGTRKVVMRKDATRKELIDQAKLLFFPNGLSPKGRISNFSCDLWDFSERKVCNDVTLQMMYDETKMPLLRFYLATWDKPAEGSNGPPENPPNEDCTTAGEVTAPQTKTTTPTRDILSEALQISGAAADFDIYELPDLGPQVTDNIHMAPGITEEYANELNDLSKNERKEVKVTIHRGHVLKEMITCFKTIEPKKDSIVFEMIMPNGRVEIADDRGGVTRDSLTEFWHEFYEECTLGTTEKVPFLRHDFGEEEWCAVAKIIVFGWVDQSYIPLQMALPFMQQCIFGCYTADLLEAFHQVIPQQESRCLRMALSDFSNVDMDELTDILDGHEVRQLPNARNIARLVHEIAHKELIQAPMYVADCWHCTLRDIGITENELASLYSEMKPTARAVCKALCFPDGMTPEETTVSNHLKRFIRELSEDCLRKFIRFCTGADLLITKKISVAFVSISGLARRPVSHTCTSLLELPRSYDSFPQFRTEFMGILESNIWVMDII